jgi:5-methylcytosine-specific restriction protein A
MESHHLKTRRKDKGDTESICRECHKTIHALWTNPEIRDPRTGIDTIEGLMESDRFKKAVGFIRKVRPGASISSKQSNR